MVIPEGLEPPTYRLGICRSILMSYGTTPPICPNSSDMARCGRFPCRIGIAHTMPAGAITRHQRAIGIGKEHPVVLFHAHPRSAGQQAKDTQPFIAAKRDGTRSHQRAQFFIGQIGMPPYAIPPVHRRLLTHGRGNWLMCGWGHCWRVPGWRARLPTRSSPSCARPPRHNHQYVRWRGLPGGRE